MTEGAVQSIVTTLGLMNVTPAQPTELSRVEADLGRSLPSSFKEFYLNVGGARGALSVMKGGQVVESLAEFWSISRIGDEIAEDPTTDIVPFAEDIFGNWFCVLLTQGNRVALFDWNNDTCNIVAESFEGFLQSLQNRLAEPAGSA